MLRSQVRTKQTVDGKVAVDRAVDTAGEDAADVGFKVSLEETPSGATNTLRNTAVEPRRVTVGNTVSWWWGWTAPYAEHVNDGTAPHWAPIAPLREWARRVLGDESAAYAVRRKIAEEGTEPQEFAEAGLKAAAAFLRERGMTKYLKTVRE